MTDISKISNSLMANIQEPKTEQAEAEKSNNTSAMLNKIIADVVNAKISETELIELSGLDFEDDITEDELKGLGAQMKNIQTIEDEHNKNQLEEMNAKLNP